MNILFICKHNVFRSKVSESYFKKINRNKKIKVDSAGVVKPFTLSAKQKRLIKLQKKIAKEFGIDVKWNPKQLTLDLIRKQDIIVIAANDVCRKIFINPTYGKKSLKIIQWKIQDVQGEKKDEVIIRKSIKRIIKRVNKLERNLK